MIVSDDGEPLNRVAPGRLSLAAEPGIGCGGPEHTTLDAGRNGKSVARGRATCGASARRQRPGLFPLVVAPVDGEAVPALPQPPGAALAPVPHLDTGQTHPGDAL